MGAGPVPAAIAPLWYPGPAAWGPGEALQLAAVDRARFATVIANADRPDFLQTWEWGELKRETGWVPHRLLVPGPDGAPVGAASVLERRLPGLGPLHYVPRGPIVDWADADAVTRTLRAIADLGRQRRAVACKLDPGVPVSHPSCGAQLAAHGWRQHASGPNFEGVQPRFHMQLPLAGRTADDLLAGMHPKTRYNIRLAERRGVRVRPGTAADLAVFYALLQETAHRDGFLVRSLGYFQGMWRHCLEPGLGWLLLAEADGQCLAGAIVFCVGRMAWYLYGASSSQQRELMPAYAVQWDAILRALQAGCHTYDFRGVSGDLDPDNPLHGLFRFKRGFGAQLVELVGEWDRPYRPTAYWAAERALPVARRALARLRRRETAQAPDA